MKKEYIYIGIGVLAVGGLIWWSNRNKSSASSSSASSAGNSGYQFDPNSDEYAAFEKASYEKYMIGGKAQNNDVIITPYGVYTFTVTKQGVAPAYINDGYWTKSNPTELINEVPQSQQSQQAQPVWDDTKFLKADPNPVNLSPLS